MATGRRIHNRLAVLRVERGISRLELSRAIGRAVRTEGAGWRYAALAERLRRGPRQGAAQAGP